MRTHAQMEVEKPVFAFCGVPTMLSAGLSSLIQSIHTRRTTTLFCVLAMMTSSAFGGHIQLEPASADDSIEQVEIVANIKGGESLVSFDEATLAQLGLGAVQLASAQSSDANGTMNFAVSDQSSLKVLTGMGQPASYDGGTLTHNSGLVIAGRNGTVRFDSLKIQLQTHADGAYTAAIVTDDLTPMLDLLEAKIAFDRASGRVFIESASVTATQALADALGVQRLAGHVVGTIQTIATTDVSIRVDDETEVEGGVAGGNNGTDCWNTGDPLIGPDVIVGVLDSICNYDTVGGIDAFSVGTVSCNIGSSNLSWQASPDPDHPVIGQNIFKLKGGRIEQIGQSWLKHGFTALTLNDCGCGCSGPGGSVLGVGCSDPYGCGLNGGQGGLGPKSEINPSTGVNPGTHDSSSGNAIYKRSQVKVSELEVSSASVRYFAEGQYVAADDAAAGNSDNNNSYIAVSMTGSGSNWNSALIGTTQREQAGIRAWNDTEGGVTETDVNISGDGLVIVAAKATDLGNGYWHYEYAVQNLTSDRAIGTFSVPTDVATSIQNVGFHDVDYHSGEPYDGTDWTGTPGAGWVTWATTAYAMNPNANALRWGTLYNFRFDANRAPTTGSITLGIFKPGSPSSVTAMTVVPTAAPVACITPTECDDGLFCSGAEDCVAGFCAAGVPPCSDLCDEALNACVECLSTFDCDDGVFCNGAETCSGGACVDGAEPCVLFCDEPTDTCINCLANVDCDDGVFCNGSEACAGGACFPAGSGVVNGGFNGSSGWVDHTDVGGPIVYANQLEVNGPDGDGGGFTWADQANVIVDGGNLQFTIVSYTSSDSATWDYPVVYIDGDYYGIDDDGTLGPQTPGGNGNSGTINNGNQVMNVNISFDLDAIAGPGSHTVGFGVHSVDGLFGGGILIVDNVLPAVTPADPCEGQCCNEAGSACVPCNVCGNGILEFGEQCDDDNTANCDGCDSTCQAENVPSVCVTVMNCIGYLDNNACNHAACVAGPCDSICNFGCIRYGDVKSPQDGIVNLDDILATLSAFSNFANAPDADISPCGSNSIINLDDILSVLSAFAGFDPCGCEPAGQGPICGSEDP